jgi:flagellar protein FliS
MAPNAAALKAYQSVKSESMAHGGKGVELVVMLYDGIIESLVKAQGHIERKEWRDAGRQFARALTIVAGLRETLDFERGQPVADNLFSFYNALSAQLIKAQARRDVALLQECIKMISEVKDSWVQLAKAAVATPVKALTSSPSETTRSATVPIGAAVAGAY